MCEEEPWAGWQGDAAGGGQSHLHRETLPLWASDSEPTLPEFSSLAQSPWSFLQQISIRQLFWVRHPSRLWRCSGGKTEKFLIQQNLHSGLQMRLGSSGMEVTGSHSSLVGVTVHFSTSKVLRSPMRKKKKNAFNLINFLNLFTCSISPGVLPPLPLTF